MAARPSLCERIEARIVRIPIAGCWIWTDTLDRRGYARLSMWQPEKKSYNLKLAHRLVYQELVGPIPDGLVLMHRCDTPACVNPHHLTPGTQIENLADMRAKGRHKGITQTHCINGHPLSGENIRIEGTRKIRRCKACEKTKKAAKWLRLKQEKENA